MFANQVYDHEWLKRGSPSNVSVINVQLGCEVSSHLQNLIYGKRNSTSFDGFSMLGEGATRHLTYRTKQAIKPLMMRNGQSSSIDIEKMNSEFMFPKKTSKLVSSHKVNTTDSNTCGPLIYSVPIQNRYSGNF